LLTGVCFICVCFICDFDCLSQVSVQSKLNVPGPEQGLVYDAVEQVAMQLLGQQQAWVFPVQACL
jgi:hypothetical protein